MQKIAAIRFPSPLPQLDHEFDFLVPDQLELTIGSLVEVPFGTSKKAKSGIVVEIKFDSDFSGTLTEISQLISPHTQLSQEIITLCESVALRQAGTVGELLASALPKRFVRVDKAFSVPEQNVLPNFVFDSDLTNELKTSRQLHYTPELLAKEGNIPSWAIDFATACGGELTKGKSSLVVLPDYRELRHFEMALENLKLESFSHRHASSDKGSDSYRSHLLSMQTKGISYGTRSACFAPANDLGLILLWDDGDESHIEQGAPYWNSREVLLARHEIEKTKLVIASHSPSSESLRLIDVGYLKQTVCTGRKPLVRVTENFTRLDDETFGLISKTLSNSRPVLIQINNSGFASAVACTNCKEIRKCPSCSASIWIDPLGNVSCRSCKHKQITAACLCGGTNTRPVRVGAAAVADQLRKSFPASSIVESNGENPILFIKSEGVLVVATTGAEPDVEGGYDLMVIADAAQMIGAPRLRALERAVCSWANALSLGSDKSLAIFVGLSGRLAEQIKALDFNSTVAEDYADRVSLALPPSTRVGSVTATNSADFQKFIGAFEKSEIFGRLRVLPSKAPLTIVIDYQFADGIQLAKFLVDLTRGLADRSKDKLPGERVYRINMDDSKVI